MQVYTRQVDEALVIDERFHVTVLEVEDDHVRLGITSPDEDPSYREEVLYYSEAESPYQLQMQ